jgi:hypothetical protein
MSWISPMIAVYAAAVAVPLLVAMYFLKLKRRQMLISSTLLWKRAVQDLQVNSPFQRLRKNLLLLLQLLAMAAALAALGRPVISMTSGPPRRYVLLIDRSASMNATDVSPNRLEFAKSQAKELITSLRARSAFSLSNQADQAMVIAFDEHAKVMCNYTSDKRQLASAVDAIGPTDGQTSLAEAVTVARAFAQSAGPETNNKSNVEPAQLELFSDGRIPDAEEISVGAGELNFHCAGTSGRNIAVTAMQARRAYEKPEDVEVFATLANYGEKAVGCDVQLSLDGAVRGVRAVGIPPARPAVARDPGGPGTVSVSFTLSHSQAGVVEVRAIPKPEDNCLTCDDAAWAVLPPPRNLRTLLVTRGNPALEPALKACPLVRLEVLTPEAFDALDQAELSANPRWDVVVLDNHTPAKLPRGRYIVFGKPPTASGVAAGPELTNQLVVDWRARHPVLQFVNLSNLFVPKAWQVTAPADATVLAEFASSPALLLVRRQGSVFLLAPFDCWETSWPFEPGFVIFCYNATGYMGLELGLESSDRSGLRVNQAISLEGLPPGTKVKMTGPGGAAAELAADASGAVRYPGTTRAGVYEASAEGRAPTRLAVNLLDEKESAVEPVAMLHLSGQVVAAKESVGGGNVEAWPILVMLALALASVEWLVYKRKVRV